MNGASHGRDLPGDGLAAQRPQRQTCVFCEIIAGQADLGVCLPVSDGFVAFPAKHQRPGNRGHMLLVPTGHYTTLEQLPAAEVTSWLTAVTILSAAVRDTFHATGTTIRMNLGPPGQDVAHLHTHLIPRHPDDGFATARSQVLSLPDRLAITRQLTPHLDAHRAVIDSGPPPHRAP